jgi:hypothetical protein
MPRQGCGEVVGIPNPKWAMTTAFARPNETLVDLRSGALQGAALLIL